HFLFLVSLQKGKIYIAPRATKIYNSKEIKRIIVSKDTGKLERFVEQKEGEKIVKVFPLVYRKKGIGYLVGIFDNERVCEGFEKIDDEYLFLTHVSSLLWGVFQGEKLVRENVALKEAIRRLEKSLKLQTIGEIASSVAHEFKNILQSLESNLEIVGSELELAYAHSDRCLNLPAVINELKKANKAIDEGNMIVERLRGFVSRKEEFKPVNIRVLLSEVLDFVNPVIKNKERKYHKSIKLELISASDVYVMGSALKLKEVITNLILNGVDAISKEGVIQIGTQVKGKYVTIMVSDNGCGMSTSVKRRVFTPYFTTKKDGTGLGLALSLRFIKDHKGKIEFESVKGKGTVFKVILPIYRKAEDLKVERGDEEKYKAGKGVILIKPVIGNLRFLIVDDNDIYRESLAKLLSARGFYV
ncbi:MAG: ATP-binding protein, partial [bacterium]